jgi:kynurenine formamidase
MAANDDYRTWLRALHAEHRFGDRDRLGTANHIDAEARRRGLAAVVDSTPISLARPLSPGPSARGDELPGFKVDVFYTEGPANYAQPPIGMGSDHVEYDCHGSSNTHIDSINHLALDRTWYCGWAVDDPDGPSIARLADHGLVTRGVVIDVPAVRGTDWADPAQPVSGDDIDAALARGGLTFEPGDALLLYMGRDRWEAAGKDYTGTRSAWPVPGPGWSAARWIADHGVSMLAWDFLDTNHPDEPQAPVHLLIWGIGLILIDNCELSAAAAAARASGRIAGQLVVAPVAIPGGTGAIVRPLWLT